MAPGMVGEKQPPRIAKLSEAQTETPAKSSGVKRG